MLCSFQALRKLLERAEQDFLADMHQLHIALGGWIYRGVLHFSHYYTDSSPLNPLKQENWRLSGLL